MTTSTSKTNKVTISFECPFPVFPFFTGKVVLVFSDRPKRPPKAVSSKKPLHQDSTSPNTCAACLLCQKIAELILKSNLNEEPKSASSKTTSKPKKKPQKNTRN